jgi:hypothetical protein
MLVLEVIAAMVITASLLSMVEADTRDNRVRVTRASNSRQDHSGQ